MAMGRRVLEASMRAIPGIYRNCPAVSAAPTVQFNPAAFAEAMELVEFAFRYDQIMYCFELVERGQFEVRYDPLEQLTIFIYVSGDESAADTLLRSHERDSNIELATEADKAVIIELAQEAKRELEQTILFVDPDAISYPFTPALRAVARRWAKVLATARKWEFPEDLHIGNVTFGEVRKFWGALAAIACIHDTAHLIVAQANVESRPRRREMMIIMMAVMAVVTVVTAWGLRALGRRVRVDQFPSFVSSIETRCIGPICQEFSQFAPR